MLQEVNYLWNLVACVAFSTLILSVIKCISDVERSEVATYATVLKNASPRYFGLSPNSQWMIAILNFVPPTYVFPLCLSSRCDPSFVFFRCRECLSYMFLSPTSYANILGCYLKVKPKGLYAQESIMLCPTSKYPNG